MKYRSPDFGVSLALGALVGVAVAWAGAEYVGANPLWLGLGTAIVAWVAIEQIPNGRDSFVEARGHHLVTALAVLLPVAFVVWIRVRGVGSTDGLVYLLFAALAGFFVGGAGEARLAERRMATEAVHAEIPVETPQYWKLLIGVPVTGLALVGVQLLLGGTVEPIIVLAGVLPYALFNGTAPTEREWIALDSGVVLGVDQGSGGFFIPWRRVQRLSVDGEKLSLSHLLPFPGYHRREVEDERLADAFVDAARRQRRKS